MFGVIGFYLVVKFIIPFLPTNIREIFKGFWLSTPIDCMAIGGLFAIVIYDSKPIVIVLKNILFSKITQIVTLLLTIFLIAINYRLPILDKYFHFEMYAVLFGILICNFAANENRIFSMENKVLNYLGKISYGMYMFHPLMIVLSIKTVLLINCVNGVLMYFSVFLLTVLISSLSYEFYEKPFIHKKIKYSKIISGDSAKI